MITTKFLSIGLAAAVLATGCATTESVSRPQDQEWSLSNKDVSVNTKLTVRKQYDTTKCMVFATVKNIRSSDIKGGSLNFSFFGEDGTFESSAVVYILRGLPVGQTVVYEATLNDSTGEKYYPRRCPKLNELKIKGQFY